MTNRERRIQAEHEMNRQALARRSTGSGWRPSSSEFSVAESLRAGEWERHAVLLAEAHALAAALRRKAKLSKGASA
jgi:hypothetical protein